MKSRMPTDQEIAKLLSYLPKLTADGFKAIHRWGGGSSPDGKTMTMPWPEYDETVVEFFQVASSECWSDYQYVPEVAGGMLADPEVVRTADLSQIKTMLTYCVRGERFYDGHWGAVIEDGRIERLLRRIAEIDSGSE